MRLLSSLLKGTDRETMPQDVEMTESDNAGQAGEPGQKSAVQLKKEAKKKEKLEKFKQKQEKLQTAQPKADVSADVFSVPILIFWSDRHLDRHAAIRNHEPVPFILSQWTCRV